MKKMTRFVSNVFMPFKTCGGCHEFKKASLILEHIPPPQKKNPCAFLETSIYSFSNYVPGNFYGNMIYLMALASMDMWKVWETNVDDRTFRSRKLRIKMKLRALVSLFLHIEV